MYYLIILSVFTKFIFWQQINVALCDDDDDLKDWTESSFRIRISNASTPSRTSEHVHLLPKTTRTDSKIKSANNDRNDFHNNVLSLKHPPKNDIDKRGDFRRGISEYDDLLYKNVDKSPRNMDSDFDLGKRLRLREDKDKKENKIDFQLKSKLKDRKKYDISPSEQLKTKKHKSHSGIDMSVGEQDKNEIGIISKGKKHKKKHHKKKYKNKPDLQDSRNEPLNSNENGNINNNIETPVKDRSKKRRDSKLKSKRSKGERQRSHIPPTSTMKNVLRDRYPKEKKTNEQDDEKQLRHKKSWEIEESDMSSDIKVKKLTTKKAAKNSKNPKHLKRLRPRTDPTAFTSQAWSVVTKKVNSRTTAKRVRTSPKLDIRNKHIDSNEDQRSTSHHPSNFKTIRPHHKSTTPSLFNDMKKESASGERSESVEKYKKSLRTSTKNVDFSNQDNDLSSGEMDKSKKRIKIREENIIGRSQQRGFLSTIRDMENFQAYSIARQLKCLAKKLNCNYSIEQEIIGRTAGYNDIVLWKVKEKPSYRSEINMRADDRFDDGTKDKKIIFIVHGLSVMGLANVHCFLNIDRFTELFKFYAENLDSFDIFLIPMANPDGVMRLLSQTDLLLRPTILWNKNMSPQEACPGVSVDRNFEVAWNQSERVSSCSQQYPGPHPFSEAESVAISSIFRKYGHKIVGYFNVHVGQYNPASVKGDAVLYPKGYTDVQTDDDRYIDLKGEIDEAMRNMSFKVLAVTVDTLYNWYGQIAGSSVDYAGTIYGIPYSLELVMQSYEDERSSSSSLFLVWQTILDVLFDHIYRAQTKNDKR